MKTKRIKMILSLVVMITIAGCGPGGNLTVAEKRQAIVDMEKETLEH